MALSPDLQDPPSRRPHPKTEPPAPGTRPAKSADRAAGSQPAGLPDLGAEPQLRTVEEAVLQERQRLADQLHDAVNQSLFSAGLIAEVLPRLWERSPEEGMGALQDLRRLTRCALAEMRILVADLRPSAITDTDIADLLHLLGSALAGRANIPVTVNVTGGGPLPPEIQVGLYRLCRERLGRIARHPGATRVDIDLRHEGGAGSLRIRDDGLGFEAEDATSAQAVLSDMRERAANMGAKVAVDSRAGKGTDFTVRWRDLAA